MFGMKIYAYLDFFRYNQSWNVYHEASVWCVVFDFMNKNPEVYGFSSCGLKLLVILFQIYGLLAPKDF